MSQNYPNMIYPQPQLPYYQERPLTSDVQIGKIRIKDMITINTYGPGIVIIITYLISTYNGDTIPWPVMITDTASYYPQNILFRIGLLVPLFYWGITVLLVKWWLRSASLTVYGIAQSPLWLEFVGYASIIAYGITISTIDQGQTATHLHGICAVVFLVLQCIFQISVTQLLKSIRKVNPEFISKWSMDRKVFLCYVWIIPLVALIYEAIYDDKYGIALAEWVAVYTIIFYIQSFGDDLKHYELTIDDEGFKLSDLKRKMGYAEELCVDKFEEEESTRSQPNQRNNTLESNNSYALRQNFVEGRRPGAVFHHQVPVQGIPAYAPQVEMKQYGYYYNNQSGYTEEVKEEALPQVAGVPKEENQIKFNRVSYELKNAPNQYNAANNNQVYFLDPKTGRLYVDNKASIN